jgi:hypothetical protein
MEITMSKEITKPVYESPTHILLKPINNAQGEQVKSVLLRMINASEHRQIVVDYTDNSDLLYRQLIKVGTGLTDDELKQIIMPDYNTLLDLVEEHYGQNSRYWFSKAGVETSDSVEEMTLLHPLPKMKVIKLTFPTLAVIDVMNSYDATEQDMFIKMSCTGLGVEELDALSVPDSKMLDAKVTDFLSQTASFFSGKMTEKN